MKNIDKVLTGIFTIALSLAFAVPVLAQDADEADGSENVLEEITVTGTRNTSRVSTDLPVAVDAFSSEDLTETGQTEVGRMLQKLAPSFNFSSSSISDGTDALRPATLRASALTRHWYWSMASDVTRRH